MLGNRGTHRRAAAQAPQANHECDSGKHNGNDRTGTSFRKENALIAAPHHARSWPEQGRAPVVGTVARRHMVGTRFRARSATPIVLPLAGDVNVTALVQASAQSPGVLAMSSQTATCLLTALSESGR